ncbi:right-handed parallel beta-helix repeat-containing protein, partial [Methanobrevibacter sp.]|uniref:right-handed parallel beta-helix repeat-containing protein n=1 Tax=Methanobrevibacter sp. TaxID=66852 RepID=UPI0038910D0B
MGAACAVEDSALNNTVSATQGGGEMLVPIVESADNDVLSAPHDFSGSTVQDLKNLIEGGTVQDRDTIYLGNKDISSNWGEWDPNQIINVNVPNIIISGGSSSNPDGFSTINANHAKVFSFNAAGITLNNVKIVNSNGGNGPGSAVYIGSSGCTIDNCAFESCQYNNGGAIHGSGSATNTMISNCNFTNNEGRWTGIGGAIYFEGSDNEIDGCNFDSNIAGSSGAIYSAGTLTVRNSNFTNNKGSNANGGAVYIGGENSVVDNCYFTGNEVTANHLFGGAIALAGSGSSITNSNFESNKAGHGGAVYIESPNINVENCNFTDNNANTGGAISVYNDNATITNCNFTDNSATTNGGAIYIADNCNNADMSYCNFVDNTAASGKAIFAAGSGNGKVSNCNLGGVTDLNVLGGYPELTFTLSTDYTNIVVGNIEGASGDGSKVPIVGEEIKLDIYDLNGNPIKTVTLNETDDKGQTRYDYSDLPLAKYRYTATYLDGKTKEGTFGVNIVEGDNFSSIREAINNAEPGEVLILKDKTYLNDIGGSMVIDKPIAIVGNGAVLDAEGKSGIFTVNHANNVNFENITFINGNNTDYGGAIDAVGSLNGAVTNCTFINNTANIGGGAVRVDNDAAGWNFYDSIFINNTALSVGADEGRDVPNGGGAIWSCVQQVSVYNSIFRENEGSYGGALRGSFNTYDSIFINNTAFYGNGGAIDVTIDDIVSPRPTLRYENSTFINNTAKGPRSDDRAQGGALHMFHIEHVDIVDSKFYNNTADRGGAVDLYIIATTHVENCDVENNTAHSEGGGFFINATSYPTEFLYTNITKNNAGTEGGAIYLITENALFDHIIANNNSAARGGGAFVRGDNAIVQYSTFDNNEAFRNESDISGRGGALNIWGKNCQLINVTADNNTADRGGSAFIRGDDTYVVNSSFNGNTAHIRGGGLNVGNGTNIRIINVTVSDNWANTTGGGIFVLADGTTFFNVTADNNTAQNGGGAYIEGNHVRIELGEFNNNTALYNGTYDTGLGGALDIKGNGCTIVNLTSNDNKGYRGGSTFIRGSDTTVINCTMDNNNVTFRGGALNIGGGDNARIINVSVSNNRAKDEAGAVYVVGSHSLFDNFTAINNTANMGGGFEIEGDDTTIQNSTIRNNTALNGGGMYITGDDVFLFNNNITFNKALDPTDEAYCNGGGVAIEASSYDSLVNFTNNYISSNYAQDNGGGVFIFVMSGEVYMDNVTAYNNTAENGGFCHVMCCENLVVKNSTFDSNRAIGDIFGYPDRGEGGAFHISNELNFLIDSHADIQGNFYNNTAMNGSSIYIQDSSLKVYNSTFYDNQAHSYYLPIVPLNNTKFNQTDNITISVRLQGGDNIANAIHNKDGACKVLVYNITYPFYTIDGKVIDKQTPSRYMAPVVGPNAEDIYLYDFENNQVITLILYTGAGNFTYNEETGEYVYNGNGSEVNRFDYIVQPIFEADHVDDKIIVNRAGKSTVFTYDPDSGMYINNKSGVITSLQVSPKGESMEYTFNKSGAITKVYYNSTSDEYVFNESGIITKVKYNETTGIYTFNRSGKVSNYYSINKTNINGTVNVPLTQLKGILDPGKYTVLALYRESTYYTEIYNYTTFIVKGLVEKLTVNKTVGLGDNVDFVVTVTNQYNFTLHNVTITEIFKTSELKYLDYTNKGNWTIGNITTYNVTISKNNVVNYTSIVFKYKGNLSANQSTNFTITFKTLKLGTLVNTVNLTTNETKDFILTAKNETLVINLVEKLTVNETVVIGDNVDFVVVVSNRENMTLHNVTITEIFRTSELQYVNYTNQGNWTIGKITTYNVTLPGEGLVNFTSIVFTYKGNLSAYNNTNFTITFKTLKTGTLVNTVNLTTNETGSKIFNATNTTLVYKLLEKLTVNETVRVGENVSFIVVVNNLENRTLHNVTITEIFRTSELQYVNYTNQGNWTIGKITTYNVTLPGEGLVNFTSIVFTYKGNLSANQSTNFTITFNAKVNGTLVNTVNLTTNETGNKIFNATNTTTVINNIIANLTVTKLALNTTVVVGDRVYFMVVVNNTGDFALGNVTVSEIYDSGKLTLVDYDNHDLWERNGNVFTYKGVLDVNKSANFTVWFTTMVNGTVVNTVNASSNLTGNKTAKNDTLVISPNMTVSKLALNKTVVIGDNVYFMVVVNNTGDCALGNVTVSEIYDSGKLTLVDYDNHDLWELKGDVFTYKGVLGVNESANFTVWFTTMVNGTVVNTVNASSNLTGNKTASNDTLVISPNMTVTKLALNNTVVIGDNVYFMVVVNNAGDCALADVVVSEIYDSGKLTLVDYDNHDLWELKGDVFTYKGVLGVNESANFT